MSDSVRTISLLRGASQAALKSVATSEKNTVLMYKELSYDTSVRAQQIDFWQRFLRARGEEVARVRAAEASGAGLTSAVSVAQLMAECARRDGLEPGCVEDVLALSLGAAAAPGVRVFEVLPPAWFVEPDRATYARLFPRHGALRRTVAYAGRTLAQRVAHLWRWAVAAPQPDARDEALAAARASADVAEGYFARTQDGAAAARELRAFLARCCSEGAAMCVHGRTAVTLAQLRRFPGDLPTAVSWLCHTGSAEAVFFKVGERTLCGFSFCEDCGQKQGQGESEGDEKSKDKESSSSGSSSSRTRIGGFIPSLLAQMHMHEELESVIAQKGALAASLGERARACVRAHDKQGAVRYIRQRRRIEDSLQDLTDKRLVVEQLLNGITDAATTRSIVDICAQAVRYERQLVAEHPNLQHAADVVAAAADCLQDARDVDNALYGDTAAFTGETDEDITQELASLGTPDADKSAAGGDGGNALPKLPRIPSTRPSTEEEAAPSRKRARTDAQH